MDKTWRRFLLIHLPLALVFLAFAAELAALALNDVPLRRHDLDRTLAFLDKGGMTAPVALVGDSVTQDVLKNYRVAPSDKVANLTTNQASGVVGAYFLLRRYLETNGPIRHLVIASTPEFFGYAPDRATSKVYLDSVFRRGDEIDWMARHLPNSGATSWEPAVFNLENRIGYPLLALLAPTVNTLPVGPETPQPGIKVEPPPIPASVLREIRGRGENNLSIVPSVVAALDGLCALAEENRFTIHILHAPVPETTLNIWRARKTLDDFHIRLGDAFPPSCQSVSMDDFFTMGSVPDYAMRNSDHLRRPGWTNRYALKLEAYLQPLTGN